MRKILSLLTAILFAGSMMATDYELVYTLDGSITTGGNSNYAQDGGGLTQDGLEWSVTGNTTINPWRIGGKNLDDVDRELYTKGSISENIAKIEVEHGTKTLSAINSMKIEVASDAAFVNIVSTLTPTYAPSSTVTVLRPEATSWEDCYYRITYNVDAGGSNSYLQLISVKFYKDIAEGGGEEETSRTIYLNGGGSELWNQANAVFFIHAWGGAADADVMMTQVEGDVYSASIPSDETSLVFVRMPAGSEAIIWDGEGKYWNQSTDQTIPADKNLFTMTDWSNGTWSVYGEEPEPQPEGKTYELVTSASQLVAGVKYVIGSAAATSGVFMATTEYTNNRKQTESIAITDGKMVATEEVLVLELGGETGKWTFLTTNYAGTNGYLSNAASGTANNCLVGTTEREFTIAFDGNAAVITATAGNPKNIIRYNSGSACFSCYASGQNPVYLYKEVAGDQPEEVVLPVVGLGANFNNWNYGANLLTPAEDSLSASIKVTLGVTDTLKFKIVSDNNWLSLNGEGEDGLYGLHRGWPTAEHINLVNNGRNFALNADVAGEYTFTWFYADSTLTITFPDKPENQLPVVGFGANCNVWNYGENLFVPAEDSLSASYKVTLGVTDTIQFKIVSDNNWLSLNGEGEDGLYGLHRGWPTAEHINLVNNGRNFALNADVAGEYTFTWTYADSTLTVTFPELPKFYVAGSMTDWDTNKIPVYDNSYTLENLAAGKYQLKVVDGAQWLGIDSMTTVAGNLYKDQDGNVCFILAEAGNVVVNYVSGESFTLAGSFATPVVQLIGIAGWESGNEIALTPAEDNLSASVKLNLTGEWYDFKVIRAGDWLGKENEGTDNYKIWSGCKWVDGLIRDYDGLKSVSLQPAAEGDYIFTYEYATGKLTVTFPETRLADGYYLIGLTMADWTVEYITADYLFVENAENPGEYMLDVTLAAEQQFKVVKVESDAIVTWYPDGENNNFVVDANHAGNKTVYFRPNGDGGEGWHYNVIYVAANDATAIDETVAAGKAAKVLRDGQILIIKGEKIFNVQGQRVK